MRQYERWEAAQVISWAVDNYGDRFAIATSFQREGMVVLDLAVRTRKKFRVFTLDTGRLPEETLGMVETVRQRYGVNVEVVRPDPLEVGQMVRQFGQNLFYDSVEQRQLCCDVRKVRPLERKLSEFDAWATGLRRGQSDDRAEIAKVARVDRRIKINPLADWTSARVEEYIRLQNVPEHPLYSRGYTSIGCAPCTRAVEAGEGERAGRWWWEDSAKKECGIHFAPDGSVRRAS